MTETKKKRTSLAQRVIRFIFMRGSPDGVKQHEKGEKGPGSELRGAPANQLEVGKIEETKGQMPRDG
ncbi:hypothetical protein ALC60_06683 [Trachymyrmex zeteki]|uniref:Uncharacterized protein n=1 Tax=Mycetomoellerius zeteki TaxID=64791 RepID=A0A151X1Z0_9HYME|nr:hypothetical protein ALC60_06683 [Trachymyrmex zeteki]